jgi:hypothetical protein
MVVVALAAKDSTAYQLLRKSRRLEAHFSWSGVAAALIHRSIFDRDGQFRSNTRQYSITWPWWCGNTAQSDEQRNFDVLAFVFAISSDGMQFYNVCEKQLQAPTQSLKDSEQLLLTPLRYTA